VAQPFVRIYNDIAVILLLHFITFIITYVLHLPQKNVPLRKISLFAYNSSTFMTTLELLRLEMANHGVAAAIVPSGDTHFSEYTSEHFQCRAWLTGFTGSAGTAVVTMREAALFTDSRYFLQAEAQLYAGISLQKADMPDSISIADYLKTYVQSGSVGINAALYSAAEYQALVNDLSPLTLVDIGDPFNAIWQQRPNLPDNPAFLLDEKFAGSAIYQKLAAIKETLHPAPNSVYVVSTLDQTAWLLNLRGADLKHTPVALAYSVIDLDNNQVSLFINPQKIDDNTRSVLEQNSVAIEDYAAFGKRLAALVLGKTAIFHANFTSQKIVHIIEKNAQCAMPEKSVVPCINALKSVKNEVEIAGFRDAMASDGAAWIKFWHWLEQNIDRDGITEMSAAEKLRGFRSEMPHFWNESFAPIVAFGEHGAIVHYSASPDSNARITRGNFVLIDTGGQYSCGTTDITRTLHLGAPTQQQKRDYTLVLKGHIALQTAVFPEGTRGAQIDALARQFLWQQHLLYLHGTGHGVGHFLGVHEGPQGFRLNENPAVLRQGMVTSCEPGLYRTGEYGIRIENLILTTDSGSSEFGSFLRFESLTLCPYDQNSIDRALLTAEEISFINRYHAMVYQRLSSMLDASLREFLEKKCKNIS
jgi:Xaa-Pro aminopeptidase